MAKHIYCHHTVEMDVPFFDVDALNIVWHGHYVKYLEVARCDFLSAIDYDYVKMGECGFSWPVVQLNVKYVKPARFGQKIRVELKLVEIESCLRIEYTVRDAQTNIKLTQASTTQVAVCLKTGEMQFQTPESWLAAVARHENFQAA